MKTDSTFSTIFPSASLASRALIQTGSARDAAPGVPVLPRGGGLDPGPLVAFPHAPKTSLLVRATAFVFADPRSDFIAKRSAIPADMVQARFGSAFSIEDGKIVAKDANGNKVYSRSRPGELADFDEALEVLVDSYPYKEQILKSTGASGSGSQNSNGGGGAPAKGNLGGTKGERVAALKSRFPDLK